MKQFIQLVIIQIKEFYRTPGILFWSIAFPILMSWGLGMAFSSTKELSQSIAVSGENAELKTLLAKANIVQKTDTKELTIQVKDTKLGTTNYKFIYTNWDKAIVLLKKGAVPLILSSSGDSLHYHFDPHNNEAQLAYLKLSKLLSNQKQSGESAIVTPITQTGMRYIDFLIPGMMAMNIMMSCLWGICYSLIEKRNKKLLRRMVATPMSKTAFLLSLVTGRLLLSTMEITVLFIFAKFTFNIQMQGSILAFIIIGISGLVAFSGLGILVSSKTSNTQIGNGLVNVVVMPMMILSGIFFSYHNFPDFMISIIRFLPLTSLADTMRSVFVEGFSVADVLLPSALLSLFGIICFTIGIKIYKWY